MATRSTLAVILHADVVGSTSLVQRDERVAHERIQDVFRRLSETIVFYRGTTHELRGDALLAEFHRASDAVSAAIAFQSANRRHNAELDELNPQVRVGIAIGEVLIGDGTVTGAGVVLAQRLEQLAEPDGVVVQGAIKETAPRRLPFDYEDCGEHHLKGFDEPYRVYSVTLALDSEIPLPETDAEPNAGPRKETVSAKPTVAVLPFENLSADSAQEYLSEGITEDVITELSRFRELTVIARNSSFHFRNSSLSNREIGEQLGVAFLVEGSVRRAGSRVRVAAQLVDSATSAQLWAERYDRQMEDVFEVQDEISRIVVGTLVGRLKVAAEEQVRRRPINNATAYDLVLLAQSLAGGTREENERSRELYERAIDLDPTCARAVSNLAMTHYFDWNLGWSETPSRSFEKAIDLSKEALALDSADGKLHWRLGQMHIYRGEYDDAFRYLQRAIQLNPNDADARIMLVRYHNHTGTFGTAIEAYEEAVQLNPYHPAWYLTNHAASLYGARRYADVVAPLQEAISRRPKMMAAYPLLAAAYGQLGDSERAAAVVAQIRADDRGTTRNRIGSGYYSREEDREHLMDGLRKAGLSVDGTA